MNTSDRRPLVAAGALLGIGLGGFLDGIVFHQILQVHSMLSGRVARDNVVGLEINMFWDGMFHVFTWLVTTLGVALLWTAMQRPAAPRSTRTLLGSMALGWGLFNLIEGVINHHILHLHHVVETADHQAFDIAFLASGLVLIGLGATLILAGREQPGGPSGPQRGPQATVSS